MQAVDQSQPKSPESLEQINIAYSKLAAALGDVEFKLSILLEDKKKLFAAMEECRKKANELNVSKSEQK